MIPRLALVLALSLAGSPVHAGTAVDPIATPAMWTAGSARPVVQLASMLRTGGREPSRWASLQRDLLTASQRNGASGLTAVSSDTHDAAPLTADDFDGDGKDDVLSFEPTGPGDDFPVTVRRGLDGSLLWSARAQFVWPLDLAADARKEVLALTINASPDDPNVLRQTISLLSPEGTLLWTKQIDARFTSTAFTDWLMRVERMPDATGDGIADLFVGTLDNDAERTRFRGVVLDGPTGAEHGRLESLGVGGLPWVVPAPDRDGDGLADMFSVAALTNSVGILSAHSGTNPQASWSALTPFGAAEPFVRDVDGDALPDVVLHSLGIPLRTATGYGGRDGSLMWVRDLGEFTWFAGDMDGDGGEDSIDVTPQGVAVIRLTGWSGRTGADLWQRTFRSQAPDGAGSMMVCRCPADLSGDGVWDPLIAAAEFDDAGLRSLVLTGVDGSNGSARWSAALAGSRQLPVPIEGDADGNGAPDLVSDHTVSDRTSVRGQVALRLHDGLTYAELWRVERPPVDATVTVLRTFGADLVGSAADEVVVSISSYDGSRKRTAQGHDPSGMIWEIP